MYSLLDLINHLIIPAIFIGRRTRGKLIGANTFGLYDVGFGNNQKELPGNADGDPTPFFSSLHLFLCWFLALTDTLSAYRLIYSPLPCIFVSSYSTNWHDLGIMELGQRSRLY